jgi:hypothetical protein
MSIFQAGNIIVTSTNFTSCAAQGVPQSANVFVSGGGLHVQASDSFFFQNGSITNCSVRSAVSAFLQSGGGALGAQNVSLVEITGSIFRDNSDSSSSGIIFLQQLQDDRGMNVTMDRSLVFVQPSSTPALNISCGSNCSQLQQQRIHVRFQNFNISAYSEARAAQYDTSAMMSLPASAVVYSARNSSLNCLFNFTDNVAVLISNTGAALSPHMTLSCAPCARPFEIALTSRTLDFSNFSSVKKFGQGLCQTTASSSLQQCPYGIAFCSTIVNVSVGFWVSFSANGKVGAATRCPPNYCGCRNIPDYKYPFCQLEPPFAQEFQPDVRISDNLCNGNRAGLLCGGCKPGFTQSLDGYSCISNEECATNVGWTWTATIIGYLAYSIYIVYSSTRVGDGLITCLLFYGQMSSFAVVSQPSATGAEAQHSSVSSWSARVAQFSSVSSLYSQTCFGPNMGSYAVTAAGLCGPAVVLVLSLAFVLFMKLRHKDEERFSILATLFVVVLFILSTVASVVFQLVSCAAITIDNTTDYVVFIDGNVECYHGNRSGLLAVAVFLCLFPFLLAAALRRGWLPQSVQTAVCGAFKKERVYWGVVTSIFRLVMSIVFAFSNRDFPSTVALIQSFLCVAVLVLMMHHKPHREEYTHYFDILCHVVLIFQFGFSVLVSVSESLGVSTSESNLYFATLRRSAAAIGYLRCVSRCLSLSSLHFVIFSCCAPGSYITFIAGITLWLYLHRTSIHDKILFCCRSIKGFSNARFDHLCFATFCRCRDCFLYCKCRRASAQAADLAKRDLL